MTLNNKKTIDLQVGKFLIAEPFMFDPNFKRSVILLCEHQPKEGSIGFVLNKPLKMKLNNLLSSFPEFESEVYFGGPVQTDTIHYVHRLGDLLPDSVPVTKGVWWGGNFEVLKSLAQAQAISPDDIRFFIGYSGWGEGQLKEEMEVKSWILTDSDLNFIFNKRYIPKLWKEVLRNEGDTLSVIAQIPDEPYWS